MKDLIVILICLLLAAGCTQPSVQPVVTTPTIEVTTSLPVHEKHITATVQRIDSTKILITYEGGPDADQLIDLQTTVITSKGSINIQSMGSRLDTTPVQIGGTISSRDPIQNRCMSSSLSILLTVLTRISSIPGFDIIFFE